MLKFLGSLSQDDVAAYTCLVDLREVRRFEWSIVR